MKTTSYICDECGIEIDGTKTPAKAVSMMFAGALVELVANECINPLMPGNRHYHRCCFDAVVKRIGPPLSTGSGQ